VHRGDDRNRQLAPLHRRLLDPVGVAVGALGQRQAFLARDDVERGEIEPRGEAAALAGQHDAAQPGHGEQRAAGFDQRVEHRLVECVELVLPCQQQHRDAVAVHGQAYAVVGRKFMLHRISFDAVAPQYGGQW
jgi:hypothetical protein